MKVRVEVNGVETEADVGANVLLVEFLRETLGLTGTHVGCDTSQCGACVVHLNGKSVKSCTTLVVQADGAKVSTIEGMAEGDGLSRLQASFKENHALQCGFCTPGVVMSVADLLKRNPRPNEKEVRTWLEGNFCRCTGYHNIVKAVLAVAS